MAYDESDPQPSAALTGGATPHASSAPTPQEIVSAISGWITEIRWYMGQEKTFTLAGNATLARTADREVLWLVISDGAAHYNVPVVAERAESQHTDSPRAISRFNGWNVYDAAEHPAGQSALLELLESTGTADRELHFIGLLNRTSRTIRSATKLTSEQSNTSVIYHFDEGAPVIVKVFRVLAAGRNPDVELQRALDHTGTVPQQHGAVRMTCTRTGGTADVITAQEFLEGAHDAWQVIGQQLKTTNGTLGPMAHSIRELGALTRTFHEELARAFPTLPATIERRNTLRENWTERARTAIRHLPELRAHQEAIEAIYAATEQAQWPELQRIHGDYHLGQVLEVPGQGWFALDFEGEPLRPLSERTREDLALRDVAGMLRSFDYAAGSAHMAGGDHTVLHAWAQAARETFLAGYGELRAEEWNLLKALVLDKALYEAVYEVTERPTWLPIPRAGILQILRDS